ncbi:hypothetical protein JTB14_037685 [Gonioctena quinquepunctata]|nr:hypothetical protein JTB14_037685 [Gonioctena quinquepunctata]
MKSQYFVNKFCVTGNLCFVSVKSSVQKPVAIKYKSAAKIDKKPSPLPKPTTEAKLAGPKHQQSSKTPEPRNTESKLVPKIQQETKILGLKVSEAPKIQESRAPEMRAPESRVSALKIQNPPSRVGSAKRTLTCYLCGREFGSASLPLHEPKCFQKWERENASLPIHLQRKPPPKPDSSMNREEWNKLAWEAAQSTLLPCTNCGRTFYPDRLLVHQRSCKTPQINVSINFSTN